PAPGECLPASPSHLSVELSCMGRSCGRDGSLSPACICLHEAPAPPPCQPSTRFPMTESFVVQRETQIAAPRANVFAFLTDPDKILRWMGTEAATEAHPGGLDLVKGINTTTARRAVRTREQ